MPGAAWLLGAVETSPPAKATKVTDTTKETTDSGKTHWEITSGADDWPEPGIGASAGNLDKPFGSLWGRSRPGPGPGPA